MSTKARPSGLYLFASADGKQYVVVNEQDGWDFASFQHGVCASHLPRVTLAGLSMYYSAGQGGTGRSWMFATGKGTVFLLGANDGLGGATAKSQNDSVLATFYPDAAAAACK